MSRISVIIPVYNAERYLPDCLESIIGQTFDDYEIIIVNDGSTDNSQKIIENFAKSCDKIKNFTIENGGVSKARNFGISVASGEYIVFADADDTVEKDYIEQLSNNARDGTLTLCAYNKIYLDRKKKYKEIWRADNKDDVSVTDDFYKVYSKWLFNSPWNKLYSKKIIDVNEIAFDIGLNVGEDLIFNAKYVEKSKINSFIVINKPLYNYYVRNVESNSTRYDYSICEKVLTHRDYIMSCMKQFNVTEEEKANIDGTFFNQINEYLYIKLDKKQMLHAFENEKLLEFLKIVSDVKSKKLTERNKFNTLRRIFRRKRKIADIKASIRGVR